MAVSAKVVRKGIRMQEYRNRFGEMKVRTTSGEKTASVTVELKDVTSSTRARALRKQHGEARIIEDQTDKKFAPSTKFFSLCSPSKAPRKGIRVRENPWNGEKRVETVSELVNPGIQGDTSQETAPHRVVPPLKFFRKGRGKGKAYRTDILRKQFLRRELTSMNY